MDQLAAMRAFVEIVDRGSLTAAAETLDRSQPTMVRTLAALEAHLGATLLRRTTRRMSLTFEGRDYLERCRRILADIDEAERAIGQSPGALRGDLRVTAPVQYGQMHLVPTLAPFLAKHERVRVDVLLLDRNADLIDEGIDLAIRIGSLADSSLIAVTLHQVREVVCASPALLNRVGVPGRPADLASLPCIRQQNLPGGTSWSFRDANRDVRVRVNGPFGANQIAAARTACIDGLGFGRFLSYQVDELVKRGELVTVLDDFAPDPRPVSVVYPGNRLVSTRARALINWLKQELSADRGAAAAGTRLA